EGVAGAVLREPPQGSRARLRRPLHSDLGLLPRLLRGTVQDARDPRHAARPRPAVRGAGMTRIKTVRERTSLPSQLAGIVAVVVPPLGLAAAVWLLWDRGVHPLDLALLAVFYVACGLGITVGFHRLFTHKSFETSAPLRALWAI